MKWTALGFCWKPHSKGGSHKYLNHDDSTNLVNWAEENQPTAEEFNSHAYELCKARSLFAAGILQNIGFISLASEVLEEVDIPSRSWVNSFLLDTDLVLKSQESLDAMRFKYTTSGSVSNWFSNFSTILANANPYLLFNFDEVMLSVNKSRNCAPISLYAVIGSAVWRVR